MSPKLTHEHVRRLAVVYVRQSTQSQVATNKESQRRQYALAETARQMGFARVEVIDDDLGRSGAGTAERPGFKRLVGSVCAGEVGAIFSIEGSRLARNGRDWHLLIEMCAMVGTLIVDPDGVYDPRSSNDRLLLGIKGTMNEFELHLIRERAQEALLLKAKRGALRIALPVGYSWDHEQIIVDPDLRVQEAIRLVLQKFDELRSARQVLPWLEERQLHMPVRNPARSRRPATWEPPTYSRVLAMLTHPAYAGAYSFGKTASQTHLVDGLPRKTAGHKRPQGQWHALIRDHHPGYITWAEYERNLAVLSENTHTKKDGDRKSGRGGRALLSGMLRCRRCGHMLSVRYAGQGGEVHRYYCRQEERGLEGDQDGPQKSVFCVTVSGARLDRLVGHELLRVVEPRAIQAALEAAAAWQKEEAQTRRARELELEQARYEATVAARRYEQVDPDNRLVAGELESRWNAALKRVADLETVLQRALTPERAPIPDRAELLALAADLPALWNASTTETALKQRIVSLLLRELIVGVDDQTNEVVLTLHWVGEQHSELRLTRKRVAREARTRLSPEEIIRKMAGRWTDREIALTMNRLLLRTATLRRGRNTSASPTAMRWRSPSAPRQPRPSAGPSSRSMSVASTCGAFVRTNSSA